MTLALGLILNLGRAIDKPSAQESNRPLNASLHDYEVLTEIALTANVMAEYSAAGMDGEIARVIAAEDAPPALAVG